MHYKDIIRHIVCIVMEYMISFYPDMLSGFTRLFFFLLLTDYTVVGPYEISFIPKFRLIIFQFQVSFFFHVVIFLDSFLMIKYNCINQKAC